jgi:hypothetical protein
MSNDEARRNDEIRKSKNKVARIFNLLLQQAASPRQSHIIGSFGLLSSFDIRASSFRAKRLTSYRQARLLQQLGWLERDPHQS